MKGKKTGGRKRGTENRDKLFKDALRRHLARNDWAELDDIVRRWVEDAVKGDAVARGQIADRLDGRPAQEVQSQVEGNLTLVVRWPKRGAWPN